MHSANMSAQVIPGAFDGPQWPHLAPRTTYLGVAVMMGMVVVSAFFVNAIVIVVSLKYKKLRSPLNYILVNLAVADMLVTIFGSSVSFHNNIFGYFTLGKAMCEFEGFMVSLTGKMVSLEDNDNVSSVTVNNIFLLNDFRNVRF